MGMEHEKVGLAQDDQRDRGGHLGSGHKMLLASARQERSENGKVVRVDSTVAAALIHEPSEAVFCGTACG
jgi:hypothetical protein